MGYKNSSWKFAGVAGVLSLYGCGSAADGGGSGTAPKVATGDAAALTDAAAKVEAADAEVEAKKTDSGSDDEAAADAQKVEEPNFLAAVRAARAYTRELLGITPQPLREFKAAVEAARALATDRDDFKDRLAPAKAQFIDALAAQRSAADAAREAHKAELDALFDATKAVFLACSEAVDMVESCPHRGESWGPLMSPMLKQRVQDARKARKAHDESEVAGSASGSASGSPSGSASSDKAPEPSAAALVDAGEDDDTPVEVVVVGRGAFPGSLGDLVKMAHDGFDGRHGHGENGHPAAPSADCQAATDALLKLVPVAAAPSTTAPATTTPPVTTTPPA